MSTPKKSGRKPIKKKKVKSETPPDYRAAPKKSQAKKLQSRKKQSDVNLEHFRLAGFEIKNGGLVWSNKNLRFEHFYKTEGASSFYKASFFGGIANVQLIPLIALPEFLERLVEIENEEGAFYDKITLREGDRNMHGQSSGFSNMSDSAEELLLKLNQYKRHGALIGEGGTFEYIQVCFINLA